MSSGEDLYSAGPNIEERHARDIEAIATNRFVEHVIRNNDMGLAPISPVRRRLLTDGIRQHLAVTVFENRPSYHQVPWDVFTVGIETAIRRVREERSDGQA